VDGDLSLLARVRFVVFDFDGVFTDNRVLVDQDGREAVFCSRADGLGLERLGRAGIPAMILSTERNAVVQARADKLGLECVHGCPDKWAELQRILAARGLPASHVAYVGNDVNDSECLRHVGVPICVADAHADVKPLARLVTARAGGDGAVREICDLLMQAHGR
jgi:YrbI family 3-deoxy-D-manno-octulosonate 8-phosphate phosphatase